MALNIGLWERVSAVCGGWVLNVFNFFCQEPHTQVWAGKNLALHSEKANKIRASWELGARIHLWGGETALEHPWLHSRGIQHRSAEDCMCCHWSIPGCCLEKCHWTKRPVIFRGKINGQNVWLESPNKDQIQKLVALFKVPADSIEGENAEEGTARWARLSFVQGWWIRSSWFFIRSFGSDAFLRHGFVVFILWQLVFRSVRDSVGHGILLVRTEGSDVGLRKLPKSLHHNRERRATPRCPILGLFGEFVTQKYINAKLLQGEWRPSSDLCKVGPYQFQGLQLHYHL